MRNSPSWFSRWKLLNRLVVCSSKFLHREPIWANKAQFTFVFHKVS